MRRFCPKRGCRKSHHFLIHFDPSREKSSLSPPVQKSHARMTEPSSESTQNEHPFPCTDNSCSFRRVSLPTVPAQVSNPTSSRKATLNVLLDTGCSNALLSPQVAEQLGLKGKGTPVTAKVKGIGGNIQTCQTEVVSLLLQSLDKKFTTAIEATILPQPTGDLKTVPWHELKAKHPHLVDLPLPAAVPTREVDLIIGQKYHDLLEVLAERSAGREQPVARQFRLGWAISGPYHPVSKDHDEYLLSKPL